MSAIDYSKVRVQSSPLYAQLASIFQKQIQEGAWRKGDLLPSEVELAREFGVSVGTARKALGTLDDAGWIVRRQGRGTFVASPSQRQQKKHVRLLLTNSDVSVFEACESAIVDRTQCVPSRDDAHEFRIDSGEKLNCVRRLFTTADQPVVVERILTRPGDLPHLDGGRFAPDARDTLFEELSNHMTRCLELVDAAGACERVAGDLNLKQGVPVLHTRHIFEVFQGRVAGVVERWMVAASVRCAMVLN